MTRGAERSGAGPAQQRPRHSSGSRPDISSPPAPRPLHCLQPCESSAAPSGGGPGPAAPQPRGAAASNRGPGAGPGGDIEGPEQGPDSAMWGRADRAVKLLGRNIPSILRMAEGVDPKISRRLSIKCPGDFQPKSRFASGVPGYKPTEWERKFLLWAGHFKRPEDIPETVSLETVRAAKTTLRVKCSYAMIALTIVGCIVMVVRGKQAMKRHESLTNINLEKKAQLRAESASAKP